MRGTTLRVELRRNADRLELAVINTGSGLPPDFSFETGGSFGMKVVRTLAQRLRGTVDAERREPGTCFILRLPLNAAPEAMLPDRQ